MRFFCVYSSSCREEEEEEEERMSRRRSIRDGRTMDDDDDDERGSGTTPGGGSRRRDAFVACLFLVALLRYLFDDSSTSSSGFTTKGVVQFEKRWEVVRRRGGTKGGGRPPLPVAFFDLNGDGRQETLIANDDATVGIYDGSERRTSSSTLEKMMRSDISQQQSKTSSSSSFATRLLARFLPRGGSGDTSAAKKKRTRSSREEEKEGDDTKTRVVVDKTKHLRVLKMVDLRETTTTKTTRVRRDGTGKSAIAIAAGRPTARRGNEERRRGSTSDDDDDSGRKGKGTRGRIVIKRKAIFAVVTEELRVMAFDHNAKKKWERSAKDALFSGRSSRRRLHPGGGGGGDVGSIKVEEIAVMVVSAKGKDEDGLVVVGGRVEHANREEEEGEEEDDDYDRGMEAYERELNDEDTLSMHRGGRRDKSIKFKEEGVEEVIEDDDYAFASENGAFVYLAFNARSGELVWRRVASDFVADPAELLRTTTPMHEVRLDPHLTKIEEHKSKTDGICRSYRESALAEALPHAWRDAEDTRMRSAPFGKSQKQTSSLGDVTTKRGRRRNGGDFLRALTPPAATTNLKAMARDPNFAIADKTNSFSSLLSRGFSYLNLGKSAVHHSDDEREKLDYHNRQFHQHMMSSSNNNIKNAIIAHHRDGVEVLDAFTGELICQLALQHPGYHADINGDGVIDHLDARGHRAHIADVAMDNFSPGCWASVTSGAPDVQTIFEGSICKPTRKSHSLKSTPRQQAKSKRQQQQQQQQQNSDFYLRNKNKDDVDVLTPIIVRRDDKSERNRSFRRATKDAVFLNSRGELTCYAKDGTKRWMVNTRASWKIDVNGPPKDGIYDLFPRGAGYGGGNNDDDGDVNNDNNNNNNNDDKEMDRFVPTLATFKFRTHHRHHGVSHNNIVMSSSDGNNRTNSPFVSQRSLLFNKRTRRHHTLEASLIVGSKRAVIVSPSGTKIATIFLPSMPIARAQVLDCNDDGKNDFIVRTETSTICYAQKNTSALSVYVIMLTSLVLSSFVAFINRVELESSFARKKDDDEQDYRYKNNTRVDDSENSSDTGEDEENHEEEKTKKKEKKKKKKPRFSVNIKYFARSTDVDIKRD